LPHHTGRNQIYTEPASKRHLATVAVRIAAATQRELVIASLLLAPVTDRLAMPRAAVVRVASAGDVQALPGAAGGPFRMKRELRRPCTSS
jgi:hypothetical protein